MKRKEYMNRLEQLLLVLPEEEREEALQYYMDYFEDAGIENEEKVICELGSPEEVAAKIEAMGRKALIIKADVSDPEQVKEMFDKIVKIVVIRNIHPRILRLLTFQAFFPFITNSHKLCVICI